MRWSLRAGYGLALALACGCAGEGVIAPQDTGPARLLVRYRAPVDGVARQGKRALKAVPGLEVVDLAPGASPEAVMGALRRRADVLYVERDWPVQLFGVPDDPQFAQQWHLENTGQTGGTADVDLNATAAWDVTLGSPTVVVALLDTGIDYTHPDLAANVWRNPDEIAGNGVDDDGNGWIDDVHGINVAPGASAEGDPLDDHGHGTRVAGVIAAVGNNGLGVSGVAPRTSVLGCKFLSATGSGSLSGAITCLDYVSALRARGVNVVATNNSWGGVWPSAAVRDAVSAQLSAGILFVAAAGNSRFDTDDTSGWVYPATFDLPHILSVTVFDALGAKPSLFNYGRHTVHLAAPGDGILTTARGGGYATTGATSIAAPQVSGVAALVAATEPTADWRRIRNLLLGSGVPSGALAGLTVGERRLRAWDASGAGALSCAGQTLVTRLRPSRSPWVAARGLSTLPLRVLSLACGAAVGPVTVVDELGAAWPLVDDGTDLDQAAGDGTFSGGYVVPGTAEATHVLTFPGADPVTVRVLNPYRPASSEASGYRSITGAGLSLGSTQAVRVSQAVRLTLPFPIRFGDDAAGFSTLYVADEGTLSFTDTANAPENDRLPSSSQGTLIAPWWSDLDLRAGGDVFWEVVGTAPSRELVLEWRDVLPAGATDAVSFQVVFFEASSDVLFVYRDVLVAGAAADAGGLATVGVQVAPDAGQTYSHLSASLSDGLTLRWRTNELPVADAGGPQVVEEGTTVTLDGSASGDGDGAGTFTVAWRQLTGPTVTLDDAAALGPSFVAPAGIHALSFELTVVDDYEAVSRDVALVDVGGRAPELTLLGISPDPTPEGTPALVRVLAADPSVTPSRLRLDWLWQPDGEAAVEILAAPGEASITRSFADDAGGPTALQLTATDLVDETGAAGPQSSSAALTIPLTVVNVPPALVPPAPASVTEGEALALALEASDPGGVADPLRFELVDGPGTLTLSPEGSLAWTPAYVDAAAAASNPGQEHLVTVAVIDDEDGRDELTLGVVVRWRDADADGMADSWESSAGLDASRDDGAEDADGDELSNLVEFQTAHGGPYAPAAPTLLSPAEGARVHERSVELRLEDAVDPDSAPVAHVLQVFVAETLVHQATVAVDGSGETRLGVDLAPLAEEGEVLRWRARGVDERGARGPFSPSSSFTYEPGAAARAQPEVSGCGGCAGVGSGGFLPLLGLGALWRRLTRYRTTRP